MRKILISTIIILLIILCVISATKSVAIGSLKIDSINQVKEKSISLNAKQDKAKELTDITYPKQKEDIEKTISKLKEVKEEYENILKYSGDNLNLGVTQIEKYNIEFLWTILGNYATKNNVTLTLNVKEGKNKNLYDLQFNLAGSYIGITDFLYNIEDDEKLKFEVSDFKISIEKQGTSSTTEKEETVTNKVSTNTTNKTNTTSTNSQTTTKKPADYGYTLYASFNVNNVGINLQ